jgi:hypothetical protein
MTKPFLRRTLWTGLIAFLLLVIAGLVASRPGEDGPLASAMIADGRLIQIEGVTYGTNHSIGVETPILDRIRNWLPAGLTRRFEAIRPYNSFDSIDPSLVVWVNALSGPAGTNVDCQGIRVEMVDRHGNLFVEATSSWYGGSDFWRVGHVFPVYPRTEAALTIRITPWRTNQPVEVKVANPHSVSQAAWSGRTPPLTNRVGGLEIVLVRLEQRTNGAPNSRFQFETRAIYLEPVWELLERGRLAEGWEEPEWTSEDPTGNRGRMLALTEPVLRYSAAIYPNATNLAAARTLATAPSVTFDPAGTNIVWWNLTARQGTNQVRVLGLFPVGVHVFSGGVFQTNPPVTMAPVRGGAPSGWVGQSRWTTPTRLDSWNGHYTPVPVVYVHAPKLDAGVRLGVRLRDEFGHLHVAKPEGQGAPYGIYAFLVDLPSEVTNITAEVVELRPLNASFDVDTGAANR